MAKTQRVKQVVMRYAPTFSDALAYWMLCNLGKEHYCGADEAEQSFVGPGDAEVTGPDCIAIGVGGGWYDPASRPGVSTARLVAEHLTFRGRLLSALPELKELLAYADTEFGGKPAKGDAAFGLINTVKVLNELYKDDPGQVIALTTEIIGAYYRQARAFHVGARRVLQDARTIALDLWDATKDRALELIVIEAVNLNGVMRRAFAQFKAVVVQRNPVTGQVQIFANRHYGLDLSEVVAAIRRAEFEAATGRSWDLGDHNLAAVGSIPEAPVWYYSRTDGYLLNGSLTARDVPPTKLSLDYIVGVLQKHIMRVEAS